MQLLIFGATGSLGSHIVAQALAQGYTVKAFTRNAAKLPAQPRLTVIQGDVSHLDEVTQAVMNVDAVLCALGDGAKGTIRSSGTHHIVEAMKKTGVRRLICQTTLGCGDSWNNLNFFWKKVMFGFLLKKAFQDHERQEKIILESGLDFTIVRPSAFTNDAPTGQFKIGFDSQATTLRLKISRADVAQFMLEQLTAPTFMRKMVNVSN
jgi:putative NADH-flavin reductase